jgi:hypothetical protein
VKRRAWVFAFFAGPPLFLVALALSAWPLLLGSALLVAVAGYEIWRSDHPGESGSKALTVRVKAAVGIVATAVVAAVAGDNPFSAVVLGLVFLAIAALVILYVARLETRMNATPAPARAETLEFRRKASRKRQM